MLELQERSTLWVGGAVPVPVSDCTAGEFEALLAKEAVADTIPDAWGVKVMVKDALCPELSVSGNDIPLSTYSELLIPTPDTVTLDPVALRFPVRSMLVPTATLPKFNVAGETLSCPSAVPVPDSEIIRFGFDPLETTEILPLAAPADAGVKTALNV